MSTIPAGSWWRSLTAPGFMRVSRLWCGRAWTGACCRRPRGDSPERIRGAAALFFRPTVIVCPGSGHLPSGLVSSCPVWGRPARASTAQMEAGAGSGRVVPPQRTRPGEVPTRPPGRDGGLRPRMAVVRRFDTGMMEPASAGSVGGGSAGNRRSLRTPRRPGLRARVSTATGPAATAKPERPSGCSRRTCASRPVALEAPSSVGVRVGRRCARRSFGSGKHAGTNSSIAPGRSQSPLRPPTALREHVCALSPHPRVDGWIQAARGNR